jgi:hypothetical protein
VKDQRPVIGTFSTKFSLLDAHRGVWGAHCRYGSRRDSARTSYDVREEHREHDLSMPA